MLPQRRQPITHIPTGTRVRKLVLGGGGGSGGDSTAPVAPPATPAASGVFIDAPVTGLDYATPSYAGSTDEEGRFLYSIGESLSFSIGAALHLGQTAGGALLSPLDLVPAPAGYSDPRVKAVASLLQSLDADATVDNGIALTAEIKRLVTETLGDQMLDLAAIYTPSDAELAAALADIDTLTRSLVDAANAQGLPLQYVDPDTAEGNLVAGLTASMETVAAFDPAWGSDGAFTDATSCDPCHAARDGEDALRDAEGNDIGTPHGWRQGIMAHAFDDPYFQAVMEEESRYRFPRLAGAIEDKCLSCHAPMGHLNAHSSGAGLDADGYYRYAQAVQDMDAREAIGCTLCHQIEATTRDADGQPVVGDDAQGGHFSIGSARIIYGPYGGPGDIAVTNRSGHKLPTSYPSRRVWVHLRVRDDSSGATVFESGGPGADGRIATDSDALAERCFPVDKPADFSNDGCYEPAPRPHRQRTASGYL